MGIPTIHLIDFDTVELVNLAPQGYLESDLDKLKVDATRTMCQKINSTITVGATPERFTRSLSLSGDYVFCCVDSITTRKFIWEQGGNRAAFFCDGRMNAEVLRILCAYDSRSKLHYPTTLFDESEAYVGSCTAQSTIYASNVIAGLMVCQFTRRLRDLPVDLDVSFNMLSTEVAVKD